MIAKLNIMLRKIKISYFIGIPLLGMVLVLSFQYVSLRKKFIEFKTLHGQSVDLTKQMMDIKASLAEVDNTLNQLNKFSSKLKVIARIKNRAEGSRISKKEIKEKNIPIIKSMPGKIDLDRIQLKVKDLKSEAIAQEHYLAELDEFFTQNETLLASVPSLKPVFGRITSRFGFRKTPIGRWQMHEGVDMAANYGSGVFAPADGLVEFSGHTPGYGRQIVIDHGYGLKTVFAHASNLLVKAGQFVKRGTKIALVGASGKTRGVHLHYEVRLDNTPVDPSDYIF